MIAAADGAYKDCREEKVARVGAVKE